MTKMTITIIAVLLVGERGHKPRLPGCKTGPAGNGGVLFVLLFSSNPDCIGEAIAAAARRGLDLT